MAPKVRITKDDIINASIDIIKREGLDALNARAVASALGCSTQPVFSNFATMEELLRAVLESSHRLYLSFLEEEARSGKYTEYKSFGLAYIRFAKEERELFKLLFMRDRTGESFTLTADYSKSIELIMESNGFSREIAELMHLEMWVFVHGIATMLATSYLDLEESLISTMLSDVYNGLKTRFSKEK